MSTDKAKSIFFDLLEIPQSDRDHYIRRVCNDESLEKRGRSLLKAHLSADAFLGGVGDLHDQSHDDNVSAMPAAIGAYRVLSALGEGGFGRVYLCEQDEPIRRQVAIKVLHDRFNSPTASQRFEEERLLLSRMNHPGIAHVLDAGRTEEGHPFIVMEHVDGQPITSYSDSRQLTIHQRVELCVQACRALQHAHQKGVIHRDIKPSNVLVCEVDGEPCVKVIDFGVSKAFVDELRPENTITHTHQLVGTPQYMSPEQASAGNQSLDTRSDVYALGVLLYELLSGHQPFDSDELRSASAAQLERIIRETDPSRPSARVAQDTEHGADTIARLRHLNRSQLIQELRGELDWITLRAMEKEPDRRYPTANSLGDDLNRALRREAVEAGPPSRVYRARRLVARHRLPATLGLFIAVSLVVITVLSMVLASRLRQANIRIQTALENREQVLLFTEDMLSGIDPAEARGRDTTLFSELLSRAAKRLDEGFSTDPAVDARLRVMLGSLYESIGDLEQARIYLEDAERRAIDALGDTHPQAIQARNSLGSVYAELSMLQEACVMLEGALRAALDVYGTRHERAMEVRGNLATVYNALGLQNEAIEQYRSLLADRVEVLGDNHDDTMATRNNLAHALRVLKHNEEAQALFELVLEHQLGSLGDDHPHTLMTRTNLTLLYAELGMSERAIGMNRDILAQKTRVLGERHPSVLVSIVNLASVLEPNGQVDPARELLERALSISLEDVGETHQYTLTIRNNLAGLLSRAKDFEAALPHQQQAFEGLEILLGPTHPVTIQCGGNYVRMLLESGMPEQALPVAEVVYERAREAFGADDSRILLQLKGLADAQHATGQSGLAKETAAEFLQRTKAIEGDESDAAREAEEYLLTFHEGGT